jgi:hypothetical protein
MGGLLPTRRVARLITSRKARREADGIFHRTLRLVCV